MLLDNRSNVKTVLEHYIATDSEWDNSHPDPWISTSFRYMGLKLIYMTNRTPYDIRRKCREYCKRNKIDIVFTKRDDRTNLVGMACDHFKIDHEHVKLVIFYAAKDLEYAFGFSRMDPAYRFNWVTQSKNIRGTIRTAGREYEIKDLIGLKKGSLKGLLQAVGLPVEDKTSMDEYKKRMWDGLNERPEDFIRYAAEDASVLLVALERYFTNLNSIMRQDLGIPGRGWTLDEMPLTMGSQVAGIFEKWMYSRVESPNSLKVCLLKLGVINPPSGNKKVQIARNELAVRSFRRICSDYRSYEDLQRAMRGGLYPQVIADLFASEKQFRYTAMSACSRSRFVCEKVTNSAIFGSLLTGGRCHNERPDQHHLAHGADIDLATCYGTIQKSLTFPIGLPSIISFTPQQQVISLGEWLDREGDELIDRLWMAVVSGDLPFDQDVLVSKLTTAEKIARKGEDPSNPEKADAELAILLREIRNAVVTSDNLRTLQRVCSNLEWKSFRDLNLVMAACYRKSDRLQSPELWMDAVLKDNGTFECVNGVETDSRTKAWFGIPIADFIDPLLDKRAALKNELKKSVEGSEEWQPLKAQDEIIKLIVNTTYGVLASPYFRVGNSVLGNVITSAARDGVWKMAKALGSRQSITDGGIYDPAQVPRLSNRASLKLPGIATFANMSGWENNNRDRGMTCLEGWKPGPEFDARSLDSIALLHIRDFWAKYDLDFSFNVEHKCVFESGAWNNKGDYALLLYNGKSRYAIRGKSKDDGYRPHHPTADLLDAINQGEEFPDIKMEHTEGGLLRIATYKLSLLSNGYKHIRDENLRPGDELPKTTHPVRFNNAHFPCRTVAEFLQRTSRKKKHRGKNVPFFEKFLKLGVRRFFDQMSANSLQ